MESTHSIILNKDSGLKPQLIFSLIIITAVKSIVNISPEIKRIRTYNIT